MIYTIIIPDIDWLIKLVKDFFELIRKAYPDENISYAEIKREENDNG